MACDFLIYQGKYDVIAGTVLLEAAGHGEGGVELIPSGQSCDTERNAGNHG